MNDGEAPHHEACLLSCAMRGGTDVRTAITSAVSPEMFAEHRAVAEVVLPLAEEARPAADTVRAELGEQEHRMDLIADVRPAPTAYQTHVDRVQDAYAERQEWALSHDIKQKLGEEDASWQEVASMTQDRLDAVQKAVTTGQTKHVRGTVDEALQEIEEQQQEGVSGIPASIPELSTMVDGWREQAVVVIAARPSQGKTALALAEALHAACEEGVAVALFSLEMGRVQLVKRMIAQRARVNIREPMTDKESARAQRAAAEIEEAPIYIDDGVHLGPLELRARARKLQSESEVGLVIVDYLQLMQGPRGRDFQNRNKELGAIARENKKTAKSLEIPLITLAQLNRGVENRNPPRPKLSDLRDSGEIEEHTDLAAFLYRPEEYGIAVDEQGNPTDGVGEIIIDKQRNGPTGTVEAAFVEEHAAWEPLDERSAPGEPEDGKYAPKPGGDTAF
jgi:replicative DNA helicase